jgi:hypothetical protein
MSDAYQMHETGWRGLPRVPANSRVFRELSGLDADRGVRVTGWSPAGETLLRAERLPDYYPLDLAARTTMCQNLPLAYAGMLVRDE